MKTLKHLIAERAEHIPAIISMAKSGRFQTPEEFVEWISSKGYIKPMGSGAFSFAFASSKSLEFVLKVSRTSAKGAADGWPAYGAVAMAEAGNNSLYPKIAWMGKIGEGTVAIIEALTIDEEKAEKIGKRVLDKVDPRIKALHHMTGINYNMFWHASLLMAKMAASYMEGKSGDLAIIEFRNIMANFSSEVNCKIEDLWEILTTQVKPGASNWDLHGGNIGWRNNGEAVFLDPVG